jgi:hypothetical protein
MKGGQGQQLTGTKRKQGFPRDYTYCRAKARSMAEKNDARGAQIVVTAKLAVLKRVAEALEKSKGLKYSYQLSEWGKRFDDQPLKCDGTHYHEDIYAKDMFMEAAKLAGALYKISYGVEVESYATIVIEEASSEIDAELAEKKVRLEAYCLQLGCKCKDMSMTRRHGVESGQKYVRADPQVGEKV